MRYTTLLPLVAMLLAAPAKAGNHPEYITDGRPHTAKDSYFKSFTYRVSPTVYEDKFTADGSETTNWLNLQAYKAVAKKGARTSWLCIAITSQEKEGPSIITTPTCPITDSDDISTRLWDLLRIARTWRDEGPGDEKTRTFNPSPSIRLSLTRYANDATIWWSISNTKATYTSSKLEDLSKFAGEFATYQAWAKGR